LSAIHFEVGVVVAKRRLTSPWADFIWVAHSILPEPPATPAWTKLGRDGTDELFYAGSATITLYTGETGHYADNLLADPPKLWVTLRPIGDDVELVAVTADPYEGESMVDNIGDSVEPVPMPEAVRVRIAAFYQEHHVEVEFIKRKRKKADPEALARRSVADLDRMRRKDEP
jgi:hypothetical protein